MSAPPSLSATVTGIDADGTLANAAAKRSLETLAMTDVVGDIGTNSNHTTTSKNNNSRRSGGGALTSSSLAGRHHAAAPSHIASYFTQTKQRLDRARCTSLTLQQLAAKLPAVKADARHGTPFTDTVGERARHAVHVAKLLGRDPADFPPLVFPPGGVVDAIEELIDTLETDLAHSKSSSSGGVEMPLCETFIRGECTRGVTCSLSHSRDAVTGWVTPWLRRHTHSNAAVISQLAKASPEGSPLPPVQCTLTTAEFPLGQEAWAVIVDAVRSSRWSEYRPPLARIVARHVTKSALKVLVPAVQYNWLHSLTALDLSKNELPAKMVLKLAAALPTNPVLAELNLSDCQLGLAGALVILRAISAELPKPPPAGQDGVVPAASHARAPAALRGAVSAARRGVDDDDDDIARAPVTSQSYLPPADARCGVKALNLAANSINSADPAFPHLCVAFADALPFLEKLNLAGNGLGPEALRRLLKGPMERYPVRPSAATAKPSFPPPLPALRFLNVSNNRLGDSGFAAVGDMLYGTTVGRSLLFLDLSWNRATHEGAASVANAVGRAARETIAASSAAGSPHAGQSVAPSPNGQSLPSHTTSPMMTQQQQEELMGAFASSQSMGGFGNMGNSVLGRSGDAASLMASMQMPLPHTPGGGSMASPKGRALPPQLQSLNLHYNLSFGRKGALAIAQLLKAETNLTAVDLRWTSLGDEGLASLQEALMANRHVLELPIGGNDVDARGQEALALRLRKRLERGTPQGVITHGACVW